MSTNNLAVFQKFTAVADKLLDPLKVKVALDVGSRDGEVAIYLKEHYPNAQIYAFECNPEALSLCRTRLLNQENVHLVDRAVSDTDGSLDFYAIDPLKTITPHKDGNIGASSLYRASPDYPHETYSQKRISVESIKLKTWADESQIPAVDVMWMDLQGAELRALVGMGTLLKTVKLIYTEVEYKQIYVDQPLAKDLHKYLHRNNFCLRQRQNTSEWFGDELFCHATLLPWWKRWLGL